jgi:integrase
VANKWAEPRAWRRPRKAKGTNVVTAAKAYRAGDRPVAYEHAARFVAAMSPAPAMIMTTLFYTGMRPIELFALEARNVDVAGRWLLVEKSKTGVGRGVPIHDFLVPLFESLLQRPGLGEEPQLFRTPQGRPYPPVLDGGGGIKSAVRNARERLAAAGTPIRDVSPYTARHTASTQLIINGVHAYKKDQILGHAADDMSRHYTRVPQGPLIEAINTLPVPAAWRALPWWENPLQWSGRYVEGMGRRTDLEAAE